MRVDYRLAWVMFAADLFAGVLLFALVVGSRLILEALAGYRSPLGGSAFHIQTYLILTLFILGVMADTKRLRDRSALVAAKEPRNASLPSTRRDDRASLASVLGEPALAVALSRLTVGAFPVAVAPLILSLALPHTLPALIGIVGGSAMFFCLYLVRYEPSLRQIFRYVGPFSLGSLIILVSTLTLGTLAIEAGLASLPRATATRSLDLVELIVFLSFGFVSGLLLRSFWGLLRDSLVSLSRFTIFAEYGPGTKYTLVTTTVVLFAATFWLLRDDTPPLRRVLWGSFLASLALGLAVGKLWTALILRRERARVRALEVVFPKPESTDDAEAPTWRERKRDIEKALFSGDLSRAERLLAEGTGNPREDAILALTAKFLRGDLEGVLLLANSRLFDAATLADSVRAVSIMANTYFDLGDGETALALLAEAARLHPNNAFLKANEALICLELNLHQRALEAAAAAEDLDIRNSESSRRPPSDKPRHCPLISTVRVIAEFETTRQASPAQLQRWLDALAEARYQFAKYYEDYLRESHSGQGGRTQLFLLVSDARLLIERGRPDDLSDARERLLEAQKLAPDDPLLRRELFNYFRVLAKSSTRGEYGRSWFSPRLRDGNLRFKLRWQQRWLEMQQYLRRRMREEYQPAIVQSRSAVSRALSHAKATSDLEQWLLATQLKVDLTLLSRRCLSWLLLFGLMGTTPMLIASGGWPLWAVVTTYSVVAIGVASTAVWWIVASFDRLGKIARQERIADDLISLS